jgi:selenocysteine lyase/cysteine desulfurase
LINADETEIAFLKNTSEGLSLVAEGYPWRPGDSVVMFGGEFPANVYPWLHLESRGVTVRTVAPVERGRIRLEDIAAAIDDTTRLLSLSHVQYASGFRSDVAAVGRLCRERGVLFCLDAIQGLGVFPVDVQAMHVDFLAADGHKWLVSPEGAAIFYCRQEHVETLRPTSIGWKSVVNHGDFAHIDFRLQRGATRFECGTMNVPGIVGLGASLQLFTEVGVETIRDRVREITDYLVQRLPEVGARVYGLRGADEWSGIVSFELPGQDPKAVKQRCLERKVVISYRDGRLRASPHFYNNREDIDALIDALRG